MPEQEKAPERHVIIEKDFATKNHHALDVRILLGGETLNREIGQITEEQLTNAKPDYPLFQAVSLDERERYWRGKEGNDFNRQKARWTTEMIAVFDSKKHSFETDADGQRWSKLFDSLGGMNIDSKKFDETAAEKLYNRYFTGPKKTSQVETFISDVIDVYRTTPDSVDYETLNKDLAAVQWLGNIFGHTSSHIITRLVDMEAKIATPEELKKFVAEANTMVKTTDGKETYRLNTFEEKYEDQEIFLSHVLAAYKQNLPEQPKSPEPKPAAHIVGALPPAPTRPATEPPQQPTMSRQEETTESANDVNIENVIAGNGFEEIARVGWEKYREALTKISYGQMIEYQLKEIESLIHEAQHDHQLSKDELSTLNRQAFDRFEVLRKEFLEAYSKDKGFDFIFGKFGSKWAIRGKECHFADDSSLTRIYFDVNTRQAPEAYKSLFDQLREEGVLNKIDLSFYIDDAFEAGSLPNVDNTIIIYIPDFQSSTMEKIARAVQRTKQTHPEAWSMKSSELPRAKYELMYNFKIPLDATTGFVEMSERASYDSGDRMVIGEELKFGYVSSYDLTSLHRLISTYTPKNPGLFTGESGNRKFQLSKGMQQRRKYMPGLIFTEALPTAATTPKPPTVSEHPEIMSPQPAHVEPVQQTAPPHAIPKITEPPVQTPTEQPPLDAYAEIVSIKNPKDMVNQMQVALRKSSSNIIHFETQPPTLFEFLKTLKFDYGIRVREIDGKLVPGNELNGILHIIGNIGRMGAGVNVEADIKNLENGELEVIFSKKEPYGGGKYAMGVVDEKLARLNELLPEQINKRLGGLGNMKGIKVYKDKLILEVKK